MAGEKVLVVDDDRGLRTLMKTRLEATGYQVALAGGGDEALSLALEEIYSAALLDHKMDGLDGYLETQRRAREMSVLVDVGRDISASLEAGTVLESIATPAKDLFGGDLSALFLPEQNGRIFRAIAAVVEDAENVRNDTINLGEGILGDIAKNKVGEIVNEVYNDPRVISITGTEVNQDEHLLAVPLMANEDLKGLMAVWRSGKGKEYTEPNWNS